MQNYIFISLRSKGTKIRKIKNKEILYIISRKNELTTYQQNYMLKNFKQKLLFYRY